MERDLAGLTQSEQQVQERMSRTIAEKNKLSAVLNSGSNKMLSDTVFKQLCKLVLRIYTKVKT